MCLLLCTKALKHLANASNCLQNRFTNESNYDIIVHVNQLDLHYSELALEFVHKNRRTNMDKALMKDMIAEATDLDNKSMDYIERFKEIGKQLENKLNSYKSIKRNISIIVDTDRTEMSYLEFDVMIEKLNGVLFYVDSFMLETLLETPADEIKKEILDTIKENEL